jgi:hypothetical protein
MKTPALTHRPANVLNAVRLLIFCLAIELLGFAFSGDYSVGSVASVVVGAVLSFWLLRQVHAGVNWATVCGRAHYWVRGTDVNLYVS